MFNSILIPILAPTVRKLPNRHDDGRHNSKSSVYGGIRASKWPVMHPKETASSPKLNRYQSGTL